MYIAGYYLGQADGIAKFGGHAACTENDTPKLTL